jgi:hypothetical protein
MEMQITTNTQSSFFDGPTVVETRRGSCHAKVPTTRQFGRRLPGLQLRTV